MNMYRPPEVQFPMLNTAIYGRNGAPRRPFARAVLSSARKPSPRYPNAGGLWYRVRTAHDGHQHHPQFRFGAASHRPSHSRHQTAGRDSQRLGGSWMGARRPRACRAAVLGLEILAKTALDGPARRARRKLEEALALIGQPREFCILVSDTIRGYLEERFTFHAPERTTEEFLYELRETNLLTPDQKESLGHFLQQCDLVKFARYEPGEPELRDLHQAALRLVEETEPAEPPSGGPPASGDAGILPGATDKGAAAELEAANRVLP
jgi:hypothetical protein